MRRIIIILFTITLMTTTAYGATLEMKVGSSRTLEKASWTSGNTSIAKFEGRKVTALKAGKCTLTGKANGKTIRYSLTVKKITPALSATASSITSHEALG